MIIREEQLEENYSNINDLTTKIICGNTLSILKKIPDESVNLIITSPSYYLGKVYEEYDSFEDYLDKHKQIIIECKRILKPDGAIFWNVAQTLLDKDKKEITPLGVIFYNIFKEKEIDLYLKNWIIWKFEGGETPSSRLFGRYENILWFVKDKYNYKFNLDSIRIPSKWINDKRCNKNGKNPEDFWEFDFRTNQEKLLIIKEKLLKFIDKLSNKELDQPSQLFLDDFVRDLEIDVNNLLNTDQDYIQQNLSNNIWYIPRVTNNNRSEKIGHPESGCTHPCPFPEEMVSRVIKAVTDESDYVLDIFMGSGTTCKVAEDLNRKWIGIEKNLEYCEISKFRIDKAIAEKKAALEQTVTKNVKKEDKSKEKFHDITKVWT
jgi:adenine-specific DNA-methyltransferase